MSPTLRRQRGVLFPPRPFRARTPDPAGSPAAHTRLLAQFPAPLNPLSTADRRGRSRSSPRPQPYRCWGTYSPSWGSPLALKALGEIEDERP
ncbi:hypothetical protein GCM10010326_78230 [Streptomyces xanthochromogenes]|uniref:Uncharacterized protein n=1 Tax=Streptomyces xanthochromogenes TaxID=67384 RepID=A0ABQ3AZA3_9ACTN|nr:hypothetical protein GCM10010326_78230 [Streptomyces xanthochromogenes]